MIQLSTVLWLGIFTFAVIGWLRGFEKELVALSGIVLALFTLTQFDDFFSTLAANSGNPAKTLFYLQTIIILVVTFFAYQTPPEKFINITGRRSVRDRFQTQVLGTIFGAFNGYLVLGSIWYFLHTENYPLESVLPPAANSASFSMVDNLPLAWLLEGNVLTLLVIGLFLFILIAVI
jgi:uncharacterized membrane protein required for colicin V production